MNAGVNALSSINGDEKLADASPITLILRLVLNKHGEVVRGEMIDINSQVTRRFRGCDGLIQTLTTWSDQQRSKPQTHRPSARLIGR
jgi:hypothetical protein